MISQEFQHSYGVFDVQVCSWCLAKMNKEKGVFIRCLNTHFHLEEGYQRPCLV